MNKQIRWNKTAANLKTWVLNRGITAAIILLLCLFHGELALADKGAPGFALAGSTATGTNPGSVTIGDFNGDGKPDLAVANYGSRDLTSGIYTNSGVSVLLGKGDGTFQPAVSYSAGTNPGPVAVGDFNGDGKLDLVVVNYGSHDPTSGTEVNNGISVLLGRGDGTFQTAVRYAAGTNPDSVAVGDFNGDGNLDVALIINNGGVTVLLGKSDGSFQAPVNYKAGFGPRSITVGDFNGDGKPDLAVANFNSSSVSILLGKGDGTFSTAVNYPIGDSNEVSLLALGDFNGDGKLDLAVSNGWFVSMMWGNGDGTFRVSIINYNYQFPRDMVGSLTAGDFNADGQLDLVAIGQKGVWVLLGKGNGTFQPAFTYFAGTNPVSLAVGDFNGDGVLDLSVANSCEFCSPPVGGVSVLLGEPQGTFTGVSFDPHDDVSENDGTVAISVVRTGDPKTDFTVEFATSVIEPGASIHDDYDQVPATPNIQFVPRDLVLTFAAGETRKAVSVPILDNGTADHEWTVFGIQLKNASAGVSVDPTAQVVTIRDNEAPANLDWSFLPAVGPASQTQASFSFMALKPDGTIVTVDMRYDPTPTAPFDMHLVTAHVLFLSQNGDATGSAKVHLQNDFASDGAGVLGLVLQPDGKLLLFGTFTHVDGEPHHSLVRLNQDGSLDSSFEAGFGPVKVNTATFEYAVSVLTVLPDGRIAVIVVDPVANMESILVLGADGKFDPSFAPTVVLENYCCSSDSGATTQDGKILLLGPLPGLTRLCLNGGVDDSFRPQFLGPPDPNFGTPTSGSIRAVLSQADGRLVVAGDFTSVNGTARSYIARLNPDGSLDPSFKAELQRPMHGTVTILADGSILVLSVNEFVEFDADGHVKTRFTPPRNILISTDPYFDGSFALQSEVPKRILVMNGILGVNRVGLGLGRVLLEGAATSAFQIAGGGATDLGFRFGEDSFTVYENDPPLDCWFAVQRLGTTTGPATVKITTSDGTAKAGVDYIAQAVTLNFAPFETEKLVRVPRIWSANRESRVFFVSLSEPSGATLFGQPPIPVLIMGTALPPGKITPLRMPNGGVALIYGELDSKYDSNLLVEVSSDLNTWLPSPGYRFRSQVDGDNLVVWIDNHSQFDSPRFYRARQP